MPHYPDKKNISRAFKIRGALLFLCPKEGGERRDKREERREIRDKKRESDRRETSERENTSAGNYISKPPGPKWKIRGLHRKERYSMYSNLPRGS
jgi:hypothetical protein